MAQLQSQTLPQDKFLTIAVNLINKALLEAGRTEAKNRFKELSQGRRLPLTQVQMEDKSLVRFDLALDHGEYDGKLNFGGFRTSVALLLKNLVDTLRESKPITVFSADNDNDVKLFGVTAVTVEDDKPNVMVLGSDSAGGQPLVVLRLMYLDPRQFASADGEGAGQESA
jgi:hypothetical protein